jgi:hypothetical protein
VVYDASARTMDVYVNGAVDDGILTGAVPSSQQIPTGVDVQLGNANPGTPPAGGGNPLHGTLDDVRVYDRALTPQEIAALANS